MWRYGFSKSAVRGLLLTCAFNLDVSFSATAITAAIDQGVKVESNVQAIKAMPMCHKDSTSTWYSTP